MQKAGLAKARDHRLHLAFAGAERAGQCLDVADVQRGLAHVGFHDPKDLRVKDPLVHQLHRGKADAFLMNFGQRAGQRCRHRTAHVGVVDMPARKGHDVVAVKDRAPQVRVRCVGGDLTGIGIVGKGHVARAVIIDHGDRRSVGQAGIPGGPQIHGHGKGVTDLVHQQHGKVLRFLDKGGMRGAVQGVGHVFGSGARVVGQHLKGHFIRHRIAPRG